MKKNLLSLIIVTTLAMLLVGCAPEREETYGENETEEMEAEKPESLTIWVNDDDDDMASIGHLAEKYTDDTGIEINLVPINAREQANSMSLDGPSGIGPDIWFATHNSMGRNILQGLAEPFEVPEEVAKGMLPEALEAGTFEGEVYLMPQVIETTALYYNKSLIPNPPETWKELEEFSREFTDSSQEQYGFLIDGLNFYISNMFLQGYGGYIFGYDQETGFDADDIGLNNEGAVQGAGLLQTWFVDGLIPKSINGDVLNGLFEDGKVGAVVDGPWSINNFSEALGDDLGVVPLPYLETGERPPSFLGVKGWVLSPFSEHKDWALDFMLHLVSEESLNHHFEVRSEIPALLGILESESITKNELFSGFAEQAQSATPTPNNSEMSQTWEPMANALIFISNGDDVQEVLDEAVEALREQIELANSSKE